MELEQLPPWKRHFAYGALWVAAYVAVRAIVTVVEVVRDLKEIDDIFDVWGEDDDEFYL